MLVSTAILVLLLEGPVIDDWQLHQRISHVLECDGGIHVEDAEGKVLLTWHGQEPLVPASVLKLATAAFVLDELGEDYRPKTTFLYNPDTDVLCVRGTGDPFLVSDELRCVVDSLKALGVDTVQTCIADCSNFRDHLTVEGQGNSYNPYDAGFGAFFVNFNTISVRIGSDGSVHPGESETPLTALARARARHIRSPGLHRLSIHDGDFSGPLYGLELFGALLKEKGIHTSENYTIESCQDSGNYIRYEHANSRTLADMVTSMLKYSNNVVANALLLHTMYQRSTAQPSVEQGAEALSDFLADVCGTNNFVVHEGSGLSRSNCIRPLDVVGILRYMVHHGWDDYLPEYDTVRAKSGTLDGVSCLAGTFREESGRRLLFAILLNGAIDCRDKALHLLIDLFGRSE